MTMAAASTSEMAFPRETNIERIKIDGVFELTHSTVYD